MCAVKNKKDKKRDAVRPKQVRHKDGQSDTGKARLLQLCHDQQGQKIGYWGGGASLYGYDHAQLAEVAKMNAPTLAALQKIPGVGESRVDKYGKQLLDAISCEKPGDDIKNNE